MPRILDLIYLLYFVTHIPITLFADSQALLPAYLYPEQLVELKEWYCREFRDTMMVDPPAWFKSFCLCELLVQFPFFFVATYAFFKGASKCKWIRLPIIVYSTHVATTVLPIIYHVLVHDFSDSQHPAPRNMKDRAILCAFYAPYLIIPLIMLVDALFSQAYRQGPSHQPQSKKRR